MGTPSGPRGPEDQHAPECPDPLPWVGLAVAALFFLSYPWVSPFAQGRQLLGIPLILWYVFGVWGGLILLAARQRTDG